MRPPPPISCEGGLGPHRVGNHAVASSHPSPLCRRWSLSFSSRLGRLHKLHVFTVANRCPVAIKSPLCVFGFVHPSPRAHQHIVSAIRVFLSPVPNPRLILFRLSDPFRRASRAVVTYAITWFPSVRLTQCETTERGALT